MAPKERGKVRKVKTTPVENQVRKALERESKRAKERVNW